MNETVEPLSVKASADGVSFAVHVQPRASRSGITGILNGAVKIRLTSPPVDGAANEQCINLFAHLLKVRRRDVTIMTGESSRHKVVKVSGITPEELQELIADNMP
jgi:uncharacterized protein